ncbi:MAG: ABC transporter permease [Nitrospinota bacterium]|nr:ABC transporter permease [Nitrospinota bacterium]HJM42057.1 nickel ABC transporter permease [Nitrospinota bacterium]
MRRYLLRRVLLLIPVVLGVATAVFFIIHLIPGDPVEIMLGEQARAADLERLRKTLGLDRPVLEQYVRFLGGLAKGDLGRSLHHRRGVAGLVLERLPATLELGAAAMAAALAIALPLGILAAARARSWVDHGSMVSSLLGVSIPNFWLGPMLIAVFSLRFNWLPPSGRGGIEHLILPALTLGTGLAAILTRMTRASLLEALPRDFVRTARAKGLAEWAVLVRHGLRNALLPVVTAAGLQTGAVLSGSVITESIFAWPGIGRLTIEAIAARDYPLVQGCVLAIALTYVALNLITDVVYTLCDPRVRYDS